MVDFKKYKEKAEIIIKNSNGKQTTDPAMCQITIALVYSVLALACVIKEKGTDNG